MPFRRNAVISVDFARRRQDLSEPSASDWAGAEGQNNLDLVDSAVSLIEDACSVAGMQSVELRSWLHLSVSLSSDRLA